MSLDVYLTFPGREFHEPSRIPVREGGTVRYLTREQYAEKFPGREPIEFPASGTDPVFEANITHNLNSMADDAGIYRELWRPDELGIKTARELIEPLRKGLDLLQSDPERFKKFNPTNGWGNYDLLVEFVGEYLTACEKWPDAEVSVWR